MGMSLLPLVAVFLAAVLHHSTGKTDLRLEDLETWNKNVQEEIINKHNELRRNVDPSASNMLKMEWNEDAAMNSEAWAENGAFVHSPESKRTIPEWCCGENLFQTSHLCPWSEAIQHWYDEVKNFTYGKGPHQSNSVIGHYTQVVWYRSDQMGCGISKTKDDNYLYVCQYCPAGNLATQLETPYESGEPCKRCPDACDNGLCTNPCPSDDDLGNCETLKPFCNYFEHVQQGCKATCNCTTQII